MDKKIKDSVWVKYNKYQRDYASQKSESGLFYRFRNMRSRCNNPNNKCYTSYGGRGIKCLWETYQSFKDDMYKSYLIHVKKYGKENTTLERVDNYGDYCINNCKWATWKEQGQNKRNNIKNNHNS